MELCGLTVRSVMKTQTDDGSYIHNCLLKLRQQPWPDAVKSWPPRALFLIAVVCGQERMITRLEGYAIIPREEYESLLAAKEKKSQV